MASKVAEVGEATYMGGAVNCSQTDCDAVFTPLVYKVAEGTGLRVQFACPECRRSYVVAYIDEEGVRIRTQLTKFSRTQPKGSLSAINERVATVRELKRQLKQHVTRRR